MGTAIHFIEESTGRMIFRAMVPNIPKVGEECRFKQDEFWEVVCVVHCYDEKPSTLPRVNIGIKKIQELQNDHTD